MLWMVCERCDITRRLEFRRRGAPRSGMGMRGKGTGSVRIPTSVIGVRFASARSPYLVEQMGAGSVLGRVGAD